MLLELEPKTPPALVSQVRTVGGDSRGPLVMPIDGLGWGRGLAQIDWQYHEFARSGDWAEPNANLTYGADLLANEIGRWAATAPAARAHLSPVRLGLDAYNAGAHAVARALAVGASPESVTTGSDYATDVIRRARAIGLDDAQARLVAYEVVA